MSPTKTVAMQQRWDAVMMRNYGTPPLAIARGAGAHVWDVDGNAYLDLIGGIAVSSVGHAHPAVVAAVSQQAAQLMHTSNLLIHEPGLALAEKLVALLDRPARVFFSQDGATANEAAFKIARRHGWSKDPQGRALEVVATEGAFHGRTMGALGITGNPAKREPFAPFGGSVTFVPFGDSAALEAAVTEKTAAVFVEPIQGENGVIVPPAGYLEAARTACTRANALLVVDEIQSGMGRTGEWFASIAGGVTPDIVTLAKGIAGGLPLGVCLAIGAAGDILQPGDHGSTFGGNPVSCAAALAVIGVIESDGLLDNVKRVGTIWQDAFDAIDHPLLDGNRGAGLWLALQLSEPLAPAVESAARDAGFLVNAVRPDALRLAPALNLTEAEAMAFAEALPGILDSAQEASE